MCVCERCAVNSRACLQARDAPAATESTAARIAMKHRRRQQQVGARHDNTTRQSVVVRREEPGDVAISPIREATARRERRREPRKTAMSAPSHSERARARRQAPSSDSDDMDNGRLRTGQHSQEGDMCAAPPVSGHACGLFCLGL